MAGPTNINEFLDLVRKSGVVDEKRLDAHVQKLKSAGQLPPEPSKAAGVLVRDGFLTHFQAEHIMQGKWRRFTIGKYKVLERIGSGGMGQVYLCEHKLMRRRVAVKVLPTAKAADDSARERFYREGRAAAALDHPNIVHAYDIDCDNNLHFLVMEYVDGSSLQEIVKKNGPMDVTRACHYVRQAALGLEHAHQQANLVHRDIKPGNILVDRSGVVKVLDMGLARFFNDEEDILTKKYDENVLGTADYLAPEQALDSHGVDIRADIYSLGATFFFMLTGKTPFGEGTVAQKLIWHQTRPPKALTEFRSDVPPALQQVLNKMMAKEPSRRYTLPAQVADALLPFTQVPIAPPPASEMPHLSPAASGAGPQDTAAGGATTVTKTSSGPRMNKLPSGPPEPAFASTTFPLQATSPTAQSSTPFRVSAQTAPTTPAPLLGPSGAKQQVATLPPLEEEEKAPWENFTSDTEDAAATHDLSLKDDTPPQRARSSRRPARGEALARRKEKLRLVTVVAVLSVLLLTTVGVLLWKFVLNQPSGPNTPSGRPPLGVSKDGTKQFKSVQQALRSAQIGDVIELYDAIHEESLRVDPSAGPTDVTLQAAPGREVRWVPSATRDEKTPLLSLSQARFFKIKGKGITLDGLIDSGRKVHDLIFITLSSPGLTVEDLQFVNVGENAVKVMNAQGAENQRIRLFNLSVSGNAEKSVGFYFDANPDTTPAENDYIEINDFRGAATPLKMKNNLVMGRHVLRPK
jgi:serine/threonine protein kinase